MEISSCSTKEVDQKMIGPIQAYHVTDKNYDLSIVPEHLFHVINTILINNTNANGECEFSRQLLEDVSKKMYPELFSWGFKHEVLIAAYGEAGWIVTIGESHSDSLADERSRSDLSVVGRPAQQMTTADGSITMNISGNTDMFYFKKK